MARKKCHRIKQRIRKAQECHCFYCGKHLSTKTATVDHLFPQSCGFALDGNTVVACHACNLKKGDRFPTVCEILRAEIVYEVNNMVLGPIHDIDSNFYQVFKVVENLTEFLPTVNCRRLYR